MTGGDYSIGSGEEVADGTIRYVNIDQSEMFGEEKVVHTGASVGPSDDFFSGDGTRLGVALTNVYLGIHGACSLYHTGSRSDALALLDRAISLITTENLTLSNPGLATEIELMEKLRANIEVN